MVNADILSGIISQTLRLGGSTFADTAGGATFTTARNLQLGGPIELPGTLDLRANANVSQAAAFDLGALTGGVGGPVLLTNSANSLGALGDFASGGNFALQVDGLLNLAGFLSATGRNVDLVATTGIVEGTQGRVAADLLTMRTAAGSLGMTGANVVARLGNSTAPGSLNFNDQTALLTIPLGATVQVGGAATIGGAGTIDIEGTVRSNGMAITASREIDVTGHSAIAGTGALSLTAPRVAVNGLISAGTTISVNAENASLAGIAQGQSLIVNAPLITFGGLDARGMTARLQLGTSGSVSGALDVAGLLVAGGSFATLTGTIGGIQGEAAAVIGRRSDATGTLFGDPPPNAGRFTFNACPIGAAVCHPIVIVPPTRPATVPTPRQLPAVPPQDPFAAAIASLYTVATNPLGILADSNPRRYDAMLSQTWFGLPAVPALGVATRPSRDSDEDLQLAPPNVRAEDF
jgi:hypothetical protein